MTENISEKIIEDLNNTNKKVRIKALEKVCEHPLDMYFSHVSNCFNSPDPDIKSLSIKALGEIGNDEISNVLLIEYCKNNDSKLKIKIILAHRKMVTEKSLKNLFKMYEFEKDIEFKLMIISVMKAFENNEKCLEFLSDRIDEDDEKIIIQASKTLAKINLDMLIDKINDFFIHENTLKHILSLKILKEIKKLKTANNIDKLIKILIDVFKSKNTNIRQMASDIFGNIAKEEDVELYFELLKDIDPIVRKNTLKGISFIKRKWFPELKDMLNDKNKDVRTEAIRIITIFASKENIEELLFFLDSQYVEVRHLCVIIIGKFEYYHIEISKKLIMMLEIERDPLIISEIFYTLCFILPEDLLRDLCDRIMDTDIEIRRGFVKKCYEEKKLKPAIFLFYIYKEEENSKLRAWIATIIGEIGTKDMIVFLKEMLEDENPRVRANAIESIDKICSDEEVIEIIFPFLKDFNNRVTANVAMALWQRGGLRMLTLLEDNLIKNKDELHRASAAFAIGEIKTIQSASVLKKALMDSSELVRSNVIRALGKLNDKQSISIMKKIFKKETSVVKEKILLALARMEDVDSVELIVENLNSESKNIVNSAKTALKLFKSEKNEIPVAKFIKKCNNIDIKIFLIKYLGDIGTDKSFDCLKKLCQNDDIEIQQVAQTAIENIKTKLIR